MRKSAIAWPKASSPSAFSALSRELAELDPVAQAIRAFRALETEIADLEKLAADPRTEAEMRALAEEELPAAEKPPGSGRARLAARLAAARRG